MPYRRRPAGPAPAPVPDTPVDLSMRLSAVTIPQTFVDRRRAPVAGVCTVVATGIVR